MKRIYHPVLAEHLQKYRQMAFLAGPRQSGKTTLSNDCLEGKYEHLYLNWDNLTHRELILAGDEKLMQNFRPEVLADNDNLPVIIFDEIHKYKEWKNMLKGYFDALDGRCKIIVTGSAKLNVFRHGGDSLMGRYFLYRIHPLTVAEILGRHNTESEIVAPKPISKEKWHHLLKFGGFPEPFLQANPKFYQRWIQLKHQQLFQEDLRDLSRVHDVARIELLAKLLIDGICGRTVYSELAKKVRVSEPTVREWLTILQNLYYCFSITPWHDNVSRSLLKDPKTYLWDWSVIPNQGARLENLVACHLRKATQFWTDCGLGDYNLYYLRDKDKREVDFLVTKNGNPWLMVEVKSSDNARISPHLTHFNQQLSTPHVFQVVADTPYINRNCFELEKPMIVPLLTFLSQLV